MIKQFCFICLLLTTCRVQAQSVISGRVLDSLNTPLPYSPVALIRNNDSTVIKGGVTDDAGKYIFENVKVGLYRIKVVATGYKIKFGEIIKVDSTTKVIDVPEILVSSNGISLKEVSVTTMKRTVEFKNGNITVHVQDSPLAIGNTLYDLLFMLPGVTVIDDNISINGKQGGRVLLDDRLQQQSGQQLMNLLKSINASSVEKIEILKNPPVKYDASGSGFISVKTKRIKVTGFSGSTYISYNQGFYSNKDGGLSLNYKGRDFAVFSSLNIGNDEMQYKSVFDKNITYNGLTTNFHQLTTEKGINKFASYSFGTDWFINRRNTIGIKIDGSQGKATPYRNGNNYLSDNSIGYDQLSFHSVRPNQWNYLNCNLNAEHKFDTLGTTLRFSFDYSPNLDLNKGDFENYFLNQGTQSALTPRIFRSDNNLKFTLYTGKIDFEKQIGKDSKIEAGVKGNDQSMLTNFNFQNKDYLTGEYVVDSVYTNIFSYKEQVTAGYANYSTRLNKYNFQLGVRGENTKIRAVSETNSVKYNRDYFNLFPMISASYDPSEKNSFQLSYNRRIDRPNYTTFNPYKYFVNLFVSFEGNPYMQPQYFNTLAFTHGYRQRFYNTLEVSKVANIFYGYPVQNDSTKESSNKTANLKNCMIYTYSMFFQKELVKSWMMTFNMWASYVDFKGQIDGRDYSGHGIQYYMFLTNQISLPKNYKIEVHGQYLMNGNVVVYSNSPRWALNIAVKKSFFNKKLDLTIGMNDIFFTLPNQNKANYLNIDSYVYSSFDTRRFKINLSYNFGKVKVQQRKIKSNEEESKRLGR